MNQLDQALKYFAICTQIDPSYGTAYFRMGDIHMRCQQYEEAIKCFQKDI